MYQSNVVDLSNMMTILRQWTNPLILKRYMKLHVFVHVNIYNVTFYYLQFEDQTFGKLVGGARMYYSFEMFLETRGENETFKKYNKGGGCGQSPINNVLQ